MGEPALRARLIVEAGNPANQTPIGKRYTEPFAMTDPPNYEPRPEESVAARAAAAGIAPEEMLFDLLMADEGQGIIYLPLTNYGTGDLDDMADLIRSDNVLLGLLQLNVTSTILCIKHAAVHLARSGNGSFVGMSSLAGHVTHPYFGAWARRL